MRAWFFVASLLFSTLVNAASFKNIVIFGDSLSDTGNLYEYTEHKAPASPYYDGRYSNGRLWIEHLLEAYFPGEGPSHMLNYAIAGAKVEIDAFATEEGETQGKNIFYLQSEVDSYLEAHQADAENLYIVWIGANNYLEIPSDVDSAVQQVNAGIFAALKRLADAGAQQFLVINMPDLGNIPMAHDLAINDIMSDCANKHNASLAENLALFKESYPAIKLISFDAKAALDKVLNAPKLYMFTNTKGNCYQSKHPESACRGYLFFDPVHITKSAHRLFAQRVYEQLEMGAVS